MSRGGKEIPTRKSSLSDGAPQCAQLRSKPVVCRVLCTVVHALDGQKMDMLDVGLVVMFLVFLAGIAVWTFHRNKGKHESPVLVLVRRRRELMAQLQGLVGDRMAASRLVQAEARRLNAPMGSLEALEAAVSRALGQSHANHAAR